MSRHPTQLQRTHHNLAEECVNFLERHAVPIAMSYKEILLETEKDSTFRALKMLVTSRKLQQPLKENRFTPDVDVPELQTYTKVQDELVITEKGSIFKGTKCVIELAHEGHQVIVKIRVYFVDRSGFQE